MEKVYKLNNMNDCNKKKSIEYRKEYYQKNKEKSVKYYLDNREKYLKHMKEYNAKNKDKNKMYHVINKDKISIQKKTYYEANKEKNKGKYAESMREYYINNKQKLLDYQTEYRKAKKLKTL